MRAYLRIKEIRVKTDRKLRASRSGKIQVMWGFLVGKLPHLAADWISFYFIRGVAQSGSAPALGAGSRRFKSSRPDHFYIFLVGEVGGP